MGEQKNTVVINGKVYDALSGVLLKDSSAANQKLVSDFISIPTMPISKPAAKPATVHKTSRAAHHLAHHKPQKSTTLKRLPKSKPDALARARSVPITGTKTITAKADTSVFMGKDRYDRAKQVSKSTAVSRFSLSGEPTVNKFHQPLPVKPAPQEEVRHQRPMPVITESAAKSSEDIFNAALSHSDSHKQTPVKLNRRKHRVAKKLGLSTRAANFASVALIIVVLGGFIAYQNTSNIAMRLAVSQSGVNGASLPAFKPSGFSLNHRVAASPGQITLNFKSNSDSRAFSIIQASSNWNSQTLADSFLSGKQVQRADQPDGKTVYLYDQSNATWVDGGIWYRIEGNSSLTSDQLLKIASSF